MVIFIRFSKLLYGLYPYGWKSYFIRRWKSFCGSRGSISIISTTRSNQSVKMIIFLLFNDYMLGFWMRCSFSYRLQSIVGGIDSLFYYTFIFLWLSWFGVYVIPSSFLRFLFRSRGWRLSFCEKYGNKILIRKIFLAKDNILFVTKKMFKADVLYNTSLVTIFPKTSRVKEYEVCKLSNWTDFFENVLFKKNNNSVLSPSK